eukprot:CAMPEP_0179634514 /NCGR_PEP_ID=MMETSP0932-20121108/8078_1 /TAXON_ID=548131 ORGANISM="Ostreococcus mediterraneus, Strain clade-D-RCC2596" /NCGR_SAMPLE_ID=MMETSP0932 /ASSEMBLY_ACC=CAM_ASM_000582 /LENGTH=92 /DNA_ID=CAMNT_0021504259 /DNA_START=174 /DNA_END=452 /DNA_ORIENTATION=-
MSSGAVLLLAEDIADGCAHHEIVARRRRDIDVDVRRAVRDAQLVIDIECDATLVCDEPHAGRAMRCIITRVLVLVTIARHLKRARAQRKRRD